MTNAKLNVQCPTKCRTIFLASHTVNVRINCWIAGQKGLSPKKPFTKLNWVRWRVGNCWEKKHGQPTQIIRPHDCENGFGYFFFRHSPFQCWLSGLYPVFCSFCNDENVDVHEHCCYQKNWTIKGDVHIGHQERSVQDTECKRNYPHKQYLNYSMFGCHENVLEWESDCNDAINCDRKHVWSGSYHGSMPKEAHGIVESFGFALTFADGMKEVVNTQRQIKCAHEEVGDSQACDEKVGYRAKSFISLYDEHDQRVSKASYHTRQGADYRENDRWISR